MQATPDTRKTIAFVTTGLGTGGAEHALARLLGALDHSLLRYVVVSLSGPTPLAKRIEAQDIPVVCLGVSGPAGFLLGAGRFLSVLRRLRPIALQGWMLHGNLAALLGGLALRIPVFLGIRHSALTWRTERISALFLEWLLGRLSALPQQIVYNSFEGKRVHEAKGYSARRALVIGNGFDTVAFRPNPPARSEVRDELAIPTGLPVVGMVARYHPMKDHLTFLAAARLLLEARGEATFVLVGKGCEASNVELANRIHDLGLEGAVKLLGERADVSRVMSAFDIGSLTSVSEGMSNAIGEMMSCGLACVVTDVGDARTLVADCGLLVPAGDPRALAQAWKSVLSLGPNGLADLGTRARARIESAYSVRAMAHAYEKVFLEFA